jgi:hypothetical protein
MRKLLLLTVVASVLVPALAQAWEPTRQRARKRARPSASVVEGRVRALEASRAPRPADRQPAPRVSHDSSSRVLVAAALPFWLGASWGWGYYPLWPRPMQPEGDDGYYEDGAGRLSARLEAYGGGATSQGVGSLALAFEGRYGGMNASVTTFTVPGADPVSGSAGGLTTASAHATWSIVSEAAFRLRVELGGAMLAVPASGPWSAASYANTIAFGPQVGLSGHLGLLGPLGIEGHARVTPYPVPVLDSRAAFVVRGGALAVSAGWRVIDVNGDGQDSPVARFAGPEIGLQLGF